MITKKEAFLFILGMGVGGGVTYLFIHEEIKKIMEEELEAMDKTFNDRLEAARNESKKRMYEPFTKPAQKELEENKRVTKQYNKMFAPTGISEESYHLEEEKELEREERFNKIKQYKDPYFILEDEFAYEKPEYDKITLAYYAEDDTLADENEDIIPDPDYIIGDDFIDKFGSGEDEDVIHIRNERLGIDYEVIRLNKSYQEDVMGYPQDPPRSMRRRETNGKDKIQ